MKQALARLFPVESFARNVGILTGGTAIAQGLTILALPLLTRLYAPEDFQMLAVYIAFIGIVTTASCFRYNIAIPLPESDRDGMALLVVSLLPAAGITVALMLFVIFAPAWSAATLGQPSLEPYLWMVPAGVFFSSSYNALQYWASRKKRFGLVARTRMTRAVGGVGAQTASGLIAASPFGLIFGQLLYSGFGTVGLLNNVFSKDRSVLAALNWQHIRRQASIYRRFPIWSVPEALFNTAGAQLPIILLAAFAAGPEAGFLFLAMRVMGLPMALLGSSVSQVFLAEAPARLRDGTLFDFTRRTMWKMLSIGAPPLILAGAFAPTLFPLVFGSEWARAGWLVAWMTPWFVLQFVVSPVSMVLHVLERQDLALVLQGAGLLIRVGPTAAALAIATPYVAEVYALSGALFYATYLAVIMFIAVWKKGAGN